MRNYINNWIEETDRTIRQTEDIRKSNPNINGNYSIDKLIDAVPFIGLFTYILRKSKDEGMPRGIFEGAKFVSSVTLLAFYTATSHLLLYPELMNDMKKGLEIILSS